jgi:ribosomal protein S18 acetylase RimI-like enzyme
LRPAVADDLGFLREMLYEAAAWEPTQSRPPIEAVLAHPGIVVYLEAWPRDGDYGLVAEEPAAPPLGAAWWRHFKAEHHGYGFVSETIPELCLAVRLEARGRGIGSALLAALLDEAHARELPALSLSVSERNPALRLYERAGFACVGRVGDSWTMVCALE